MRLVRPQGSGVRNRNLQPCAAWYDLPSMNALLIALMLAGAFAQAPAPGQQYSPERMHFHELLTASTKASDEGSYEAPVDLARQSIAQASRMTDGCVVAIAMEPAGLSYMYAGTYA